MLRASLINGEELAKSDVGERESRREKKAGDSRDAGKKRAKCTVVVAPHSSSSTSQRSFKDRWGPPPLFGSSGDLKLLAAAERAYPLGLEHPQYPEA